MSDDLNPFDEGTPESPAVNEAEQQEVVAEAPKNDSAEETTAVAPTGDDIPEGEEAGADVSEKIDEITDEKRKEIESDAEKRLADENSPKWFKNYVKNVYEPNLQKANQALTAFDPIKPYGDVEKVVSDLELLKGLDVTEINPHTNQPEKTARPFVENLIKTRGPEAAVNVMQAIAYQPSPYTQGLNIIQEVVKTLGIDPTRIDDFKKFAANGYQATAGQIDPDELALIPENLREAYIALSLDERSLMAPYLGETAEETAIREQRLADKQFRLDTDRQSEQSKTEQAQREQQEKAQAAQKFQDDWNQESWAMEEDSGNKLTDAFVETLVKDANLNDREALGITLLINSAINGTGVEGKKSLAILEKEGIKLDDKLGELFTEWRKECRIAANCKLTGNQAELTAAQERIGALEGQIGAKANPVVAHFAAQQAEANKARIVKKNDSLTDTQKFNKGIKPNEGQGDPISPGARPVSETERDAILANPFG